MATPRIHRSLITLLTYVPLALAALVLSTAGVACAQGDSLGTVPNFAPGVLTTIPPSVEPSDAIAIHNLIEIRADESLQWKPDSTAVSRTLYEMAADVPFIHDVWCLELTFKPLRMISIEVPTDDGAVQRKLIWYMVYRVRNTGAGLVPTVQPDGEFVTKSEGIENVRFLPSFVLSTQDRDETGQRIRKAYLDRVIPAALETIRRREFSTGKLLTSAQMAQQKLPVEEGREARGLWGVAMWEDVDPSIDFFSVYVRGLSNAYRWDDPPGAFEVGDAPATGREFTHKVLQLNFWRPGDEYEENEREIRFGVPRGKANLYDGAGEGVAHRWLFR
ncbi:hypothetical protein [Adhaeretor mobilis]|uniref:Uncharacterized protein n=1 Tax=Adhaeretor mobilis TaxID=1930276 RepID=A0A517N2V4_9BACT|nr:hypothetical protein [Adhaeretor mobilis]QDT01463.1 hypothetical protein HG15A2_48050 [Adhaeretor mobilis]